MDLVLWLAVAVVCGLLEIFTAGFFFLFLAGGALVTAFVSLFAPSLLTQGAIFAVASLLLILYARPILKRTINISDKPKYESNVDALVGQEVLVLEPVNRYQGRVKVLHTGEVWTAYIPNDDENAVLEEGKVGVISRVDGAKLVVLPRGAAQP